LGRNRCTVENIHSSSIGLLLRAGNKKVIKIMQALAKYPANWAKAHERKPRHYLSLLSRAGQ